MEHGKISVAPLSEIERLNWTLAAISKVNTVLVRAKTEHELFVGACEAVTFRDLFPLAWIGIPSDDAMRTIKVYVRAGKAASYLDGIELSWGDGPLANGPTAQAIKTASLRCNNDLLSDADFSPWRERAKRWHLRSSFSLPIKLSGDRVVAVFVVYSQVPGAFGEPELDLLKQLGEDIGFGIETLRTRTAYERALEQTEKQEQQIRLMGSILESSPAAVMIADSQNRIISVNPAFTAMTGYRLEDVVGQKPFMFSAEQHSARFFEEMEAILGKRGSWRGEVWHRHKSGRDFLASMNIIVVRNSEGATTHYVDIFSYLTDQLGMDDRVGREKLFSDAMMESMPGITYFYSRAGRFLRWNTNFMVVSGYSAEEISEMHPLDFFSKEEHGLLRDRINDVFLQGEASVEANFLTKDGSVIPYLFTGKRVQLGGSAYLVGVGIDIAQRKQGEQELKDYAMRLRAMSRQLLDVQESERRLLVRELHDTVGQELTALSLNLSLIRAALPGVLPQAVASRFDDSQTLLEDTTQNLRNLMVELRPPGLDELGLVAALREHAQRVARRSGLDLALEGTEPKPRLAAMALIALFRIVQEALNNIVKHARAKHVTIELREDSGKITLAVTDDGCGFDCSVRRAGNGQGMGMTTMRERAEAIGADLRIRSAPGEGTSLTITMPHPPMPGEPAPSAV
jgi:PAS domain S-box-containing protein